MSYLRKGTTSFGGFARTMISPGVYAIWQTVIPSLALKGNMSSSRIWGIEDAYIQVTNGNNYWFNMSSIEGEKIYVKVHIPIGNNLSAFEIVSYGSGHVHPVNQTPAEQKPSDYGYRPSPVPSPKPIPSYEPYSAPK